MTILCMCNEIFPRTIKNYYHKNLSASINCREIYLIVEIDIYILIFNIEIVIINYTIIRAIFESSKNTKINLYKFQ